MDKFRKKPDNVEYLALRLRDKKQNGGKESLLAEIVGFGIDNLGSSERDTLKEILNTVRPKNGQTLLDDYSKNSTDSEETRIETSFYLQDFRDATQYYDSEDSSKLGRKIRFMNELRKKSDNVKFLALRLCNKEKNDDKKSLLTEIVGFGIENLRYSEQDTLIKILDETYTIDRREQTLLDYYSENSTDPKETKAKTLFDFREFRDVKRYYNPEDTKSNLTRKIWFVEETMEKHPNQAILKKMMIKNLY